MLKKLHPSTFEMELDDGSSINWVHPICGLFSDIILVKDWQLLTFEIDKN